MKETRYFFVPDARNRGELPDDEAVHAVRVLRLTAGDEMMLMDGEGSFYRAQVTLATQKRCLYDIVDTLPQERQWQGNVHLAIAPTKLMERIEWMTEKAVEVGIDELSFLRRYIAHCYNEVPRVNLFDELRKGGAEEDALVLIGPEGDFSIDEVKMAVAAGFVSVDLGKSRLRTETAGLSAVMMMQLSKQ